jgi:hypothetical protein
VEIPIARLRIVLRPRRIPLPDLLLPFALLAAGCATIEMEDLSTPAPVPTGSCVTIGFMGGLDSWNDATKGARRLALDLRRPADGRYAETLENRRLDVALALVRRSLDADRDGSLSPRERVRVRWVIYGQSLGGGSATWLAWRLAEMEVPVELLLLLDSVGRWDVRIPGNVRVAAALYQDDGWLIRGESMPQLAAPERTELVRVEYDYDQPPGSRISLACPGGSSRSGSRTAAWIATRGCGTGPGRWPARPAETRRRASEPLALRLPQMASHRADPRPHRPEVDREADDLRDAGGGDEPAQPLRTRCAARDLARDPRCGGDRQRPVGGVDAAGTVAGIAFGRLREQPQRDPQDQEHDESQLDRMGVGGDEVRSRPDTAELAAADHPGSDQEPDEQEPDSRLYEASNVGMHAVKLA